MRENDIKSEELIYSISEIDSRFIEEADPVNYSATSNRASCFNHYCVGYDIHNSASYTVSTGV